MTKVNIGDYKKLIFIVTRSHFQCLQIHLIKHGEFNNEIEIFRFTECCDLSGVMVCEALNCSNGMHIKGANGLTLIDLNLLDNGNTEVDLFHNIYLRRVGDVVMKQTDASSGGFYNSPRGHGIRMSHMINVYYENLSVYGNADHGLHFSDGVYNVRLNNLDVYDNCANPSGTCAAIKCYGSAAQCDIDYDAPQE